MYKYKQGRENFAKVYPVITKKRKEKTESKQGRKEGKKEGREESGYRGGNKIMKQRSTI